jgi:hypothetical protein
MSAISPGIGATTATATAAAIAAGTTVTCEESRPGGGPLEGSVALSLCATAHPLYIRSANKHCHIGCLYFSEAAMRPDSRWTCSGTAPNPVGAKGGRPAPWLVDPLQGFVPTSRCICVGPNGSHILSPSWLSGGLSPQVMQDLIRF